MCTKHLSALFLLLLLCLLPGKTIAQEASWVWVNGDSSANQLPVRKTFGTPHPENNPGSRFYATCWTDKNGNFWLYGGHIWYGSGDRFGDLWCYYPKINQWAWIWGTPDLKEMPEYGQKGVSAVSNSPGCRLWAGGCADDKGNLWLYGGWSDDLHSTFPHNDLWRYNIATNQWTWEAGVQTHPPGAPAIAIAKNVPDTSFLPRPVWFGNIFNFPNDPRIYVFGGISRNDTVNNQLFSYNTISKEWTWVSGALTGNDEGNYGTQHRFSTANTPPARTLINAAVYHNQFVLFGGGIFAKDHLRYYNDVWVFNKTNQQWMWQKGDNYPFGSGLIPALCGKDSLAYPEARLGNICPNPNNVDSCGNFYLYGGNQDDHTLLFNDVWRYNINSNVWTLLKPNKPAINKAVFTEKNKIDIANNPGRLIGSSQWISKEGNLYLYGGICHTPASVVYNTMWKLVPDSCTDDCYTKKVVIKKQPGGFSPFTVKNVPQCLPNAFTPNGDGINDVLKILCPLSLKVYLIYNRWGQKVFETSDINQGWDGNSDGLQQSPGVYFYLITYYNKYGGQHILKGDVTLIR